MTANRARFNFRRWLSNREMARQTRLGVERVEDRTVPAIAVFQQGLSGYTSTQDTDLFSATPNVNLADDISISVDQQDATGATFEGVRQGLLRFDNIFTNDPVSEPTKIPYGSTINSATLTL